ncbi:hypothetical protein ABEB36_007334 [Hypothenemus hampei]|uniref:C2H2-type domain-containing protein n=1 Tax=Hypothenemus hampei TaxID=57062 RepID=A0ABD1EU68_HYPHA
MNEIVVILLHRIVNDDVVSTIRSENDEILSGDAFNRTLVNTNEQIAFDYKGYDCDKLYLNCENLRIPDVFYIKPIDEKEKKSRNLNFPTSIRCQNCEMNFPTKYQYQRHQCDYNSIKSENFADSTDEKLYECPVCYKIFISQANLERHRIEHENDGNNVCEFCAKQFVSENRLRIHKENHCKKAGGILKFYRSDVTVWKCRVCHEIFSTTDNANHHVKNCKDDSNNLEESINDVQNYVKPSQIETISTEVLLQCEFCNRTFSDKSFLIMHQKNHTTEKNFECVSCNKAFDSFCLAASHWQKKCSEFSNVFYLPKLLYCEYCDRTFKSHEILYNHKVKKRHYTPKVHIAINVEENKTANIEFIPENKEVINKLIQDVLKCLEVPDISRGNDDVNKIKSEPISSNVSRKGSKISLKEEIKENVEPEVQATSMNQKDGQDRKRKLNSSTVIPKKCKKPDGGGDEAIKFQCERCIKVFKNIVSLENHRIKEHIATFCCEECGQTLGSAKALLVHSRAHKSLKPYVCDTCGKSYSQTSHLWQHMRFHQGIKPFACPHEGCEARYTIRPDLKDHIRKVHTRERPFKCNVCKKCFLTGSVYYQHRLIHTNDRRYGCEICNKRFFRADALNNHKRIHTDERPYPCNVCGREFRQKGDRNKHVRTQHPQNNC